MFSQHCPRFQSGDHPHTQVTEIVVCAILCSSSRDQKLAYNPHIQYGFDQIDEILYAISPRAQVETKGFTCNHCDDYLWSIQSVSQARMLTKCHA